MLRPGSRSLALALAVIVPGMGACGDEEGGTIPPQAAQEMLAQLEQVESSVEEGNCTVAENGALQLRQSVDSLPAEVGSETKGDLFRLVGKLDELIPQDCVDTETGASGESGVAGTTPPEEEVAVPEETDPATEEEPPPEQPDDEGTGLPGPGNSDNGEPGPGGNPGQGGGSDDSGGFGDE